MPASSTTSRRTSAFGLVLAFAAGCATYVDTPPLRSSSGGAGGDEGVSGMAGAVAGATGGSAAGAGDAGRAGDGGKGADGGQPAGGAAAGLGGSSGSAGSAGAGGAAASGGTGGAGAGGSDGGSGGSAGKASGGGGGSAGAAPVATCAKNPIPGKPSWKVTASHSHQNGVDPVTNAHDGVSSNRWTTAREQTGDEWLQVDFGVVVTLTQVTLNLGSSPDDYPRKYAVRLSGSSQNSSAPVLASGMGMEATDTAVSLPRGSVGRYLLISQGGVAPALWWSVAEIQAACAD